MAVSYNFFSRFSPASCPLQRFNHKRYSWISAVLMNAIKMYCRELSIEYFSLPKIGGVREIPGTKQRTRPIFFVAAKSTTYTYLIQELFILIVQYACVVNIVIIIGICSLVELTYVFVTPAASGRHPIPRDRATAPSPTHTAALAISGKRTGVATTLGERRFFKVALPETASDHYTFCWLNGRALDSG